MHPPLRLLAPAALVLGALLSLAACGKKPAPTPAPTGGTPSSTAPAPKELRIAVVPKGTTHEFWKSVHAGAVKAERELGGIKINFRGPEKEDDRDQQVALIQNLVSSKYDAIVLAPLDDTALVAPVRMAASAKIPVVIIDSGLKGDAGKDFISYIATDNFKGGKMAAKCLAEAMGKKGTALLLRYQEGSASTTLREDGFLEGMKEFPDIKVQDPKRYAGATRATAQEASENLLTAMSSVDGVFCPNESSTYGMLLALRSRGMAGKAKLVGFDASQSVVDALRAGDVSGLVLQSPMRMGYLGVKTAVEHLRGQKVEPQIDTGVVLITRENMDTEDSKELLSPDLAKYLGGS